jgi:hypothetical protein
LAFSGVRRSAAQLTDALIAGDLTTLARAMA